MSHIEHFFEGVRVVAQTMGDRHFSHHDKMEELVGELMDLRAREGRLFLIGVGGSAANCSHAVNDFSKLCGIEAYSPMDNMSEFSARVNDEGWDTVFVKWLRARKFSRKDALFVLSVGGGDKEKNISSNIVEAVFYAKSLGAKTFGIVGREEGYTAKHGDCVVVIPLFAPDLLTPMAEAFQAVVWHSIVSHPKLAIQKAKWESGDTHGVVMSQWTGQPITSGSGGSR